MFPPMPGDNMSPWVELWREEAEPVTVLSAKVGCGGVAADSAPSNRSSKLVLCVHTCAKERDNNIICLSSMLHMVAFDVARKHLIWTPSLLKPPNVPIDIHLGRTL